MDNKGRVSDIATSVDLDRLALFVSGQQALVAQGGGQRGIFTAGVLDALLLANFDSFDQFYGTSAGALNLCAYLCRQPKLGHQFLLDITTQPEFFSLFGYVRNRQMLDMDWALEQICHYPHQLDLDMGRRVLGERKAVAAVTNRDSLVDQYLPMLQDNWRQVLLASCAIPRLYDKEIQINDQWFIDGGVSAAIPVQEAWRHNNRCIVVIRTETLDNEQAIESELVHHPSSTQKLEWYRESLNQLQVGWDTQLNQWKQDWQEFIRTRLSKSQETLNNSQLINGGRWLFGADDVYRLSHLLGMEIDSSLADLLMVHLQTYSLTADFLNRPPDDCFVIEIHPSVPLCSSSLMSSKADLEYDYQLGLKAGENFLLSFAPLNSSRH